MVALSIPNSTELVLAALATWKVGAVPIPMRWDLPEWEHHRLLEVIRPALEISEKNLAALADVRTRRGRRRAAGDRLARGQRHLQFRIHRAAQDHPQHRSGDVDPAHCVPFMAHWAPVSQPRKILVPAPMYHTNGFSTLNHLLGGDELVVLEKFERRTGSRHHRGHRITTFTATPTMLARIADVPGVGTRDLSSIEWILQGAAVMPPNLLRRWFELLGPARVVMAYGMTENLGLTALRGDEWLDHPGSVGRGFRDTEIRVVDDHGNTVGPGVLGEIYLRAPMNDQYRYIGGAPPLPRTPDGFASAGDIGYQDRDGYLYIADRRTDMIVTGGANVFPAEVESALIDHPEIADVVVIGIADQQWGRRVHAVIQPVDPTRPPTEQAVIGYAKDRLAALQGAQDRGVRRGDSPLGGHQGEPFGDGAGPRRLSPNRPSPRACPAAATRPSHRRDR